MCLGIKKRHWFGFHVRLNVIPLSGYFGFGQQEFFSCSHNIRGCFTFQINRNKISENNLFRPEKGTKSLFLGKKAVGEWIFFSFSTKAMCLDFHNFADSFEKEILKTSMVWTR